VFLFLDQTLGWALVSNRYLTSFLHRSILVWCFAAITMIVVSLLTAPAPESKTGSRVDLPLSCAALINRNLPRQPRDRRLR